MKTKPLSRIIYAYSVKTKWVSIEKYKHLWDLYNFSLKKNKKNGNQIPAADAGGNLVSLSVSRGSAAGRPNKT